MAKQKQKQKTYGISAPRPFAPPNTGDPKLDAAIVALRENSTSPLTRLRAAAVKVVALLDDTALDAGDPHGKSDPDRFAPADKRAHTRLYNATDDKRRSRYWYLRTLFEVVVRVPEGRARLVEIAADAKLAPDIRDAAASAINLFGDDKARAALGKAIHPATWNGKPETSHYIGRLFQVYVSGAQAWFYQSPKRAFDELSKLLSPAALKKPGGVERAEVVLVAAPTPSDDDEDSEYATLDKRWAKLVAPFVGDKELYYGAAQIILALPPERSALAPLYKRLGTPEKYATSYIAEQEAKLLAHLADESTIPYLLAVMYASGSEAPIALDALDELDSPAAVPGLTAWLASRPEDDGYEDLYAQARKVLKRLSKGKVPANAPVLKVAGEAAPQRPTLVYKKARKPKKRYKPGPLAKQWTAIEARFAAAGLPPERAKDVATEGVLLWATRADEAKLAIGATKIGGHPDLAEATAWPRFGKQPLTFVAQVELAAVAKQLPKSALPSRGLLSFFVADDHMENSYLERAAVLYTQPTAKLVRHELPDDYTADIYQACKVELHAVVKLPGRESERMSKALRKQAEIYADELYDYVDPEHQLLGSRDHDTDNQTGADEQLLLQVASENQSDMSWGDHDSLWFLIKSKALAKRDFSRVRVCQSE